MTKTKKITLAITIPILALFVALLCLYLVYAVPVWINAYQHRNWTELDYCEARWEISLPKDDVTIEYNFSNRGGFHGDGEEYTVCKYSTRPNEFLENFEQDVKGKFTEKYDNVSRLLKIPDYKKNHIDESRLFTPDDNFVWQRKIMYGNCTLLLAYDLQNDILYIIEDYM